MKDWPEQDRRRAPRVRARVVLSSEKDGEPFVMETVDISVSGAYCVVDRFVPLMSRVSIAMELPDEAGEASASGPRTVQAEGIVVRVEPEEEALDNSPGFRLALFFSHVEGDGRASLESFVGRYRDRSREI